MAVEVCTRGFRWSHGKQPKGTGVWWVAFDRATDDAMPVPGGAQSWGSARQWAVMEAKRRKAAVVVVMP